MNRADEVSRAKSALAHLKYRRQFTPGVVAYQLYHRPRGWITRISTAGTFNAMRGAIARRKLRATLLTNQPKSENHFTSGLVLNVSLLTGRRFYAESIIAALSFARESRRPCNFHFYDDGTLGTAEAGALSRWFPTARIHLHDEADRRLAVRLPPKQFPVLNALRDVFVLTKKLTDVGTDASDGRIYLDSDVLFFREPLTLLRLVDGRRPCHLVDTVQSYGVPKEYLDELSGTIVHEKVNTGLYFLNMEVIDWTFLEDAARSLLCRFGYSYFLEQSLAALLLARERSVALDDSYLVLPDPAECRHPTKTLHHYVNQSRWAFYVNGWKALKQELGS